MMPIVKSAMEEAMVAVSRVMLFDAVVLSNPGIVITYTQTVNCDPRYCE